MGAGRVQDAGWGPRWEGPGQMGGAVGAVPKKGVHVEHTGAAARHPPAVSRRTEEARRSPARDGRAFPGPPGAPGSRGAGGPPNKPLPPTSLGSPVKTVLSGGGQQTLLKKPLAPSGPRDRTYSAGQWALSGPQLLALPGEAHSQAPGQQRAEPPDGTLRGDVPAARLTLVWPQLALYWPRTLDITSLLSDLICEKRQGPASQSPEQC